MVSRYQIERYNYLYDSAWIAGVDSDNEASEDTHDEDYEDQDASDNEAFEDAHDEDYGDQDASDDESND